MNKVNLYIKPVTIVNGNQVQGDFQQVDFFEDETISVTSKIQDIRDISKVFTDFSQSFTLPASKSNNKIFKHFDNYFISDGAFDARKKVDAVLEINYIPFRRGKVFLNGVKMKNNKVHSYNVTFFGNTVTISDLFGDDEISQLDLSAFDHDYGASDVQTGLTDGYFSQSIIYPLITHTQRLYYNSDTSHSGTTLDGDLAYHNNNSHNIKVALRYDQLKPALKVKDIISAIETKYGIDFVDSDFISTGAISNLYMWLSKEKGKAGGGQNNAKTLGSWSRISGNSVLDILSNGEDFRYDEGTECYPNDICYSNFRLSLTITPSSGYDNIQYDIDFYRDGSVYSTISNNTGTTTHVFGGNPQDFESDTLKFVIRTSEVLFFTPTMNASVEREEQDYPDDPIFQIIQGNYSCGVLSSVGRIIVSTQMPKMKVMDFVSGLLKMFNLTVYYIDDESDANYGKIRMLPLNDFYNDNPKIFDITKYVDSSEHDIDSTVPFSEVDFEYQNPKTLLMKQHEESFGHIFGDEEFKPTGVDRGKPYKIKLPFEHMKYERLFDEDDNSRTNIMWGYSAGDNFKPNTSDIEAQGNPSANFDPVLTKPVLFYGIRTNTGASYKINYQTSSNTHTDLQFYFRPSNTNQTGYSVEDPIYTGTNSTSASYRVQAYYLGSAANIGDYIINTTDNIVTRVASIVGLDIISVEDDVFNQGDGFKLYKIPNYTLNFDNEVDEWTMSDYGGSTNSLFKNFYQTYIEDAFNPKKRIFKLTAHLPNSVLLNYKLNDRFQIGDKVFTINSINTNLKTGESKLELLNVL